MTPQNGVWCFFRVIKNQKYLDKLFYRHDIGEEYRLHEESQGRFGVLEWVRID